MAVRQYARIVGLTIVLIGVVGLVFGDKSLLDLLNIDIAEDIIHLATGGLMAYVGFALRENGPARLVVGGLGVVYLMVAIVGFIDSNPLGLFPSGYTALDNLIHLALGVLGIVIAWLAPGAAAHEHSRPA